MYQKDSKTGDRQTSSLCMKVNRYTGDYSIFTCVPVYVCTTKPPTSQLSTYSYSIAPRIMANSVILTTTPLKASCQ